MPVYILIDRLPSRSVWKYRAGRGNARAEYQHVRAVKRGTGACHVRERSERGVQL